MPLVKSSRANLIGMKVFCMINGLGRVGGLWVMGSGLGLKDKVMGIMVLPHSHSREVS